MFTYKVCSIYKVQKSYVELTSIIDLTQLKKQRLRNVRQPAQGSTANLRQKRFWDQASAPNEYFPSVLYGGTPTVVRYKEKSHLNMFLCLLTELSCSSVHASFF